MLNLTSSLALIPSDKSATLQLPVIHLAESTERDDFGLTPMQRAICDTANAGYPDTSKPISFKAKSAINCNTSKAFPRKTLADRTPRMHAAINGLRKAFGSDPFQARILDSGQAAIFINSGIVAVIPDTGYSESGQHGDGATRLMLRLL